MSAKRDDNLPRPDNENDVVHLDNFVDKMDFGDNVAEIELYKVGDMVEGDDTTKVSIDKNVVRSA